MLETWQEKEVTWNPVKGGLPYSPGHFPGADESRADFV